MKAKLKRHFQNALIVLVCSALNYAGSLLAQKITIPLYLDSLFTIFVTAATGLWGGIACALLSSFAINLASFVSLPFMLCHVCTALFAHFTFIRYRKTGIYEKKPLPMDAFLWAGLWSGLSNALLGNIISIQIFSSQTAPNVDIITQGIFAVIPNLNFAASYSGTVTNITDKAISAGVSFASYRIFLHLFPVRR